MNLFIYIDRVVKCYGQFIITIVCWFDGFGFVNVRFNCAWKKDFYIISISQFLDFEREWYWKCPMELSWMIQSLVCSLLNLLEFREVSLVSWKKRVFLQQCPAWFSTKITSRVIIDIFELLRKKFPYFSFFYTSSNSRIFSTRSSNPLQIILMDHRS